VTEATVHTVSDEEFATFLNVVRTAFLEPALSDEMVAFRRGYMDLARCHASVDADGRLAGSAYAFPTPLTVPGGGEVPCGAVSAVGVLPTHRRRGHLTGLMKAQLADITSRGEPVAALIAAEYPIYGRFGYGPACEAVALRIDARVARWLDEPTGTVELVDNDTFAKEIDAAYDRARRVTPGHIGWDTERWRVHAGVDPYPDGDEETRRKTPKVVWRDESGEVQAATSYSVEEHWEHNRPGGRLTTRPLVSATPRGSLELMRYLTEIDWVTDVTIHLRPVDEPAPLALVDGRTAYLSDRSDHLWVRLLDLPTALAARRYAAPGALVLEVSDPLGFAAGRFRLEGGPEGAECSPTDEEPDLALPVRALGAAYLGGQAWGRLAAAGWVDELRPGGLARADALFSTVRAPFCAITF
jgi:predicted acetyltransferase